MYRVRFHLGKGHHYRMWQVIDPDGRVTYHHPDHESLIMYGCRLRNQPATARRIHSDEIKKTPCAWVQCDAISTQPGMSTTFGGTSVAYDPRVAPHWRDSLGSNIDGHRYRVIATAGRKLSGIRVSG